MPNPDPYHKTLHQTLISKKNNSCSKPASALNHCDTTELWNDGFCSVAIRRCFPKKRNFEFVL